MLGFGLGLNKWRRVGGGFVGLLDLYPNAAAAYSLRKLRAAYSGSAVRVRKEVSSVSSETDIGFLADGSLDTTSLLAFASDADSGDVFVVTWYDQSLSNDATQSTAAAQPKIVSGGSLETEGSKPAVSFDGVDDVLTIPSSTSSFNYLHNGSNAAVVVVGSLVENNSNFAILLNNGRTTSQTGYAIQFEDRSVIGASRRIKSNATKSISGQFVFNNETSNNAIDNDAQFLLFDIIDGDNATAQDRSELYIDGGVAIKNNTSTNAPTSADATNDMSLFQTINGKGQEIIIYPSDQSANRTGIETNINTFYSIYP